MADNVTKGQWNQFTGKFTEEIGKLTGNKSQEIKGDAQQAAGKVQEQYGKVEKSIKKAMKDQSISIYHIDYLLTDNRYDERCDEYSINHWDHYSDFVARGFYRNTCFRMANSYSPSHSGNSYNYLAAPKDILAPLTT